MRQNLFSSNKENEYEKKLALATRVLPMATFDTPEGRKGIYRLGEDVVRTFLVREVERKRKELSQRDAGQGGSRSSFERSF